MFDHSLVFLLACPPILQAACWIRQAFARRCYHTEMVCTPFHSIAIYQITQDRCLDEPGFVRPIRQTVNQIGGIYAATRMKDIITVQGELDDLLMIEGEIWVGWFVSGQRQGIYRVAGILTYGHGMTELTIDLDSGGQPPFNPSDIL